MTVRIWIDSHRFDESIRLNDKEYHYLYTVMRRRSLDQVLVFNEINGEWSAQLRANYLNILEQKRKHIKSKPISIAIGCIKKNRMELLVEKVTELGVDNIYLIETQYSQRLNYDFTRLNTIRTEAAEQSHRISLPKIHEPIHLEELLKINLSFVLTHQDGDLYDNQMCSSCDCAIIGPEGGWSNDELDRMQNLPKLKLSNNILRSETAAIMCSGILKLPKSE